MAGDSLIGAVSRKFNEEWQKVLTSDPPTDSPVPSSIREAILASINSKTKTYRYVLPTQLAAKATRPELDARCVQANSGLTVAFDARSICQEVIVPFDRANHNVLGGSTEPYANNPLRIQGITPVFRSAQKDKTGFDNLIAVTKYAQGFPNEIDELFRATLFEIKSRLAVARVVYPVPIRTSFDQAVSIVTEFCRARTGGIRLQAVAVALLGTLGTRFKLFDSTTSHNINTADASSGGAADIECLSNGKPVLAVEVKDRPLTLRHVQDKLPTLLEKKISETIFLIQNGVVSEDKSGVEELIKNQFSQGNNIYVSEFFDFFKVSMIQVGNDGRRAFLELVGKELDDRKADLVHRTAWRDLLAGI